MSSGTHAVKAQVSASMISNPSQKVDASETRVKQFADVRMDILFTRLGAIYGQLWWTNFHNEQMLSLAKQEWSEALERFDNQILKVVLNQIREIRHFPPSLPQFVDSCRAELNRRAPKFIRDYCKVSHIETAKFHLQAIKTILNN